MQNPDLVEYVRSLETRLVDLECHARRVESALRHIGESYGIMSGCVQQNRGYFGKGELNLALFVI